MHKQHQYAEDILYSLEAYRNDPNARLSADMHLDTIAGKYLGRNRSVGGF